MTPSARLTRVIGAAVFPITVMPSTPAKTIDDPAFGKLIEGLKPGATVSAVILRKGKEVTVEGLVVPQATGQALTRGRVNVRGAGVPGAPDAPGDAPADGPPRPGVPPTGAAKEGLPHSCPRNGA